MDQQCTHTPSQPIALDRGIEAKIYTYLSVALLLTIIGLFVGINFYATIIQSGIHWVLLIAELAIVFTAQIWMNRSPLNSILFGTFPLLSGVTVAPYIVTVLEGYANGGSIVLNAAGSTVFMSLSAAVFAKTTSVDLRVWGRVLLFGLIGLIGLSLLQIFIPSLQSSQSEMIISGAGILLFAAFLAYDVQRISTMSAMGANPFLMALSLYLDIFNLFLYILRFMLIVYGDRR